MKFGRIVSWSIVLALGLGPLGAFAHEDKDPVCGMMVEIEDAHAKESFAGGTYYF